MAETKKSGKAKSSHKNPILIPGVTRFGRSVNYHKKGIWIKRKKAVPKPAVTKKPLTVSKPIGGEKNGKTRLVRVTKSKKYHPTLSARKTKSVKRPPVCRNKLRGSLTPGTVCILLAGRHAGKRVVFLKQLPSGLLLVNGPFKINGVPLRRVHQRFVIATSLKLNLGKYVVPEKLNDTYFRRDKSESLKERQAQEGDIFSAPKKLYVVKEERKNDQAEADKAMVEVIKSNPEKKAIFKYIGSPFALRSGQFPHRMNF